MAKSSGLGGNFYIAQFDLSGDVGAVQTVSSKRAVLDMTSIDKSAMERILGQKDGEISFTSFWDTAAGAEHLALSTALTTDRLITYAVGTTLGADAASMIGKQIDYAPARGQDGSLVATVQTLGNGQSFDWGYLLTTGKQTFAGAASTTSIDEYGGTSTDFGAAAYLHAFSIATGTAVVAVQDSASAGSGFANLTGMVFANVTAGAPRRGPGGGGAGGGRAI